MANYWVNNLWHEYCNTFATIVSKDMAKAYSLLDEVRREELERGNGEEAEDDIHDNGMGFLSEEYIRRHILCQEEYEELERQGWAIVWESKKTPSNKEGGFIIRIVMVS